MSGNLKRLNKTEEGDKIVALISHCNKDLNEEDRIVNLINDGDGWHFLDLDFNRTHEQLSWNWDIIDFRLLKIEKLQKQNKILMEACEFYADTDTWGGVVPKGQAGCYEVQAVKNCDFDTINYKNYAGKKSVLGE